ncbi:MAG: glycosyltransferase [Azospirillaceae bacterium]
MPQDLPLLSVVICTYRRQRLLVDCLEGLAVQEIDGLRGIEIVLVDNCPARSAQPVIASVNLPNPAIMLVPVHEPRTNVAHARNAGLAAAKGDYIAFIDDDNRVPVDWARTIVAAARGRGAGVVLAPIVPEIEPPGDPALAVWFTRDVAAGPDGLVTPRRDGYIPGFRTCNVLLRRDVALAVGPEPFDPVFGLSGGEDIDYFMRISGIGPRVVRCAEAVAHELVPAGKATREAFLKREYQGGRNYARVLLKNRRSRVLAIADISMRAAVRVGLCAIGAAVDIVRGRPLAFERRVGIAQSLGKLAWAGSPGLWWRVEEQAVPTARVAESGRRPASGA